MERGSVAVIFGVVPSWCDGSGTGSGYGDGYTYGSGYGYGSGSGYWKKIIEGFTSYAGTLAFWRSAKDATPSNGGFAAPVKAGDRQTIAGPLRICTRNALHGTHDPSRWDGDRLWLVALHGEVQWDDDKCAALEREIIMELPWEIK